MSDHEHELSWRTASACHPSSCVEVAIGDRSVYVRNSTKPSQEPLVFDFTEWRNFLAGVWNHEFDLPSLGQGVMSA